MKTRASDKHNTLIKLREKKSSNRLPKACSSSPKGVQFVSPKRALCFSETRLEKARGIKIQCSFAEERILALICG